MGKKRNDSKYLHQKSSKKRARKPKPKPARKPARKLVRKPKPKPTRKLVRKPKPQPKRKPKPQPKRKPKPRAHLSKRTQSRLTIGVRPGLRKIGSNQGNLRLRRFDEGKTNEAFEASVRAAYWLESAQTATPEIDEKLATWIDTTLLRGAEQLRKRMGRTNDVLLVGWKWHLENPKLNEARSTPHFEEQTYHDLTYNYHELFDDRRKQLERYKDKQLRTRGLELYIRTFRLPGNPPTLPARQRTVRKRNPNPTIRRNSKRKNTRGNKRPSRTS